MLMAGELAAMDLAPRAPLEWEPAPELGAVGRLNDRAYGRPGDFERLGAARTDEQHRAWLARVDGSRPAARASTSTTATPRLDGRRRPRGARPRLGGVALLVVGGIHLEQYTAGHFSVVPTIGTLFLLNFISATVLGLWLLVPGFGGYPRWRLLADGAVALAGIGVAGGALVALMISEHEHAGGESGRQRDRAVSRRGDRSA